MGNVQCCASERFHKGKPPKKPKQNKKKGLKPDTNSDKRNGVGGDKNKGQPRVSTVAEDATERAAPVEKAQETAPVAADAAAAEPPVAATVDSGEQQHNESISEARERFFGQVHKSPN